MSGEHSTVETYVPLYRKYRPQSFGDLVGQEAISTTLGHALALGKVAHAYLFCGPRGTGKTSSARIFAKSLNCEQGPTITPCQTCASCEGITQGNALDVIEFDAASNNGVEDARELIESCQFAPMSGRYKIYIIDEVHMLTTQAFNALLKTLEEPPPNVVFIFATTEAHKVLPTIISRCQRFDFNRITSQQIVERLGHIASLENIAIDEDSLWAIARHARGGLRDAVGLLDQLAVLGKVHPDTALTQKDLLMLIGAIEEDVLFQLLDAVADRDAATLLSVLGQQMNHGVEPTQLVKEIIHHLRNLLLVKAVGDQADAKALGLMAETCTRLVAQAKRFEPAELPQMLSQLATLDRTLRNTQQPQLWLEVGLLELTFRQDILLLSALTERVASLEAQLASGVPAVAPVATNLPPVSQPVQPQPVPAAYQPPAQSIQPSAQPMAPVAQPVQQAPVQNQPVHSAPMQAPPSKVGGVSWQDICAKVASIPTKALLNQHFFLLKVDGNHLTIGSASEANLNTIKRPDKLIHLQKAADAIFGQPMTLQLVLDKTPNHEASQRAMSRPVEAPPAITPESPPSAPLPAAAPVAVAPEASPAFSPEIAPPAAPPLVAEVPPVQPEKPPADAPPLDDSPPMMMDAPPMEMDMGMGDFSGEASAAPASAPPVSGIEPPISPQAEFVEPVVPAEPVTMPAAPPIEPMAEPVLMETPLPAPAEGLLEAPPQVPDFPPMSREIPEGFDGSDLGGNDETEWQESRKFSLELLQGKVME